MNRLSITTRAITLAVALLVSALLPAPSAPSPTPWPPSAAPHPAELATRITAAAACLAVDLALEAISAPAEGGRADAPTQTRRPLMPFYSFASSSTRTRES